MATVYLAEDVRHHRRVAIKVLLPELSALLGPERFLQEIELTASLQHPNILPLFDSGSANGLLYYVMPFVEGESLRKRLEREHHLPVADALRIITDVADALEYAHKRAVIHRDIKPENILLHEGRPQVADFGIALAVQQAGGARMTQTGISLGTPQYMAPEQAMGDRGVDARADVYALGVVAYEMLAGEPPFTGPTAQAIVAKVMTESPKPLGELRKSVPPHVDEAVLTALEKLPADRWDSARAFATALHSEATGTVGARARAVEKDRSPGRRVAGAWAIAGLAAGVAVGIGVHALWNRSASEAIQTRRTIFDPNATDVRGSFGRFALSPDARYVVNRDPTEAKRRLTLRRTDQLTSTPIAGSEGALSPFISWDSRQLGYVESEGIYVLPIEGGVPTRLANATPRSVGTPAWTPDGRIVFTDRMGGLSIVKADGSDPRTITVPDSGRTHVSPIVLPTGKGVLFTITSTSGFTRRTTVAVVSLGGGSVFELVKNDGAAPQYDDGHLLYVRGDGALMVAPFDLVAMRITGPAVALGDRVTQALAGVAFLSVNHGLIIYQRATVARLFTIDRAGTRTQLLDQVAVFHRPVYSPDGRMISVDIAGDRDGQRDVWLLEVATGTLSRLTNVGDGHDAGWTPDGRRVTFFTNDSRDGPIFTVPADRGGAPVRLPIPPSLDARLVAVPGNWLPDGTTYLAATEDPITLGDIWALKADGSAPTRLAATASDEHSPTASPDGHWFAYVSAESGREEVYVQRLAEGAARVQVSRVGGRSPVWSRDGRSLFYLESEGVTNTLIEASLRLAGAPQVASRHSVLSGLFLTLASNHANYDVSPDGKRFVFVIPEPNQGLMAVLGWEGALAGKP